MTRSLLLALAVLALAAAPALAQDAGAPVQDVSPPTTVVEVPGDGDDPDADPDAEATPDPCERPPGTDGDYADCGDPCVGDVDYGTDADYMYCAAGGGGGDDSGGPSPPRPRPVVAQPLPADQLPLTGGEPLALALAGLAFLMCGAGLRLRAPACKR
ncbi:MAG TPA: hypothetical protein VM266_16260 [Solirubrobacteraceae bacterium]|nr:hypothetical protein [Solirubrobacteraceae bacterium]